MNSSYLAQHLHDALAQGSTAELGVDVTITAGAVFLTGTVASAEQRDHVEAVVAPIATDEGLVVHNDVVVVSGEPDTHVEVLE